MTFTTILESMGVGMLKSIGIFIWTLLLSVPLGLAVALIRIKRIPVVNTIVKFYISLMRGTPLMLQLLVVFFGPFYLFHVRLSDDYRFVAVIIGFVLNYAAYFAEIFRSGIESMPVGQYEAANVLGYSKTQTFIQIILPQVFKRIFPALTNEVITLVKDTSLAYSIAYVEMFTIAKQIAAKETNLLPFVIAGVFYYIFNFIVAALSEFVEKKMSYYR